MEEIQNTVNYIKQLVDERTLNVIDFLEKSNILNYSMKIDKIKDGDKVIEKPSNRINIDFLKICSENGFQVNEDLAGLCFLKYQGYDLKNYKLYWSVSLSNIDQDLKSKCSYCKMNLEKCPLKALGIIKKIIADKKQSEKEVFEMLFEEKLEMPKLNSQENKDKVKEIMKKITTDVIDFAGVEFFLKTDSIIIEKVENGKIYYRRLDFNIERKSLINNIDDFKNNNLGIREELSIDNPEFGENYSYMFNVSPFKLATYCKYLCNNENINYEVLLNELIEETRGNDSIEKIAFYREYLDRIEKINCSEDVKKELRDIFTYIKNYYSIKSLPYLSFNTIMYSKNLSTCEEIQKMLLNYCMAFNYTGVKNWVRVDVNTFIRRSKDNADIMYQVEKMYSENDFVIFYNFNGLKTLNELRVDSFFAAVEKYYNINERNLTIFITEKDVFDELLTNRPKFKLKIIKKELYIDDYDIEKVKTEVKRKLRNIFEFDQELEEKIDNYIENKCSYNEKSGREYIEEIYSDIIFNEFKISKNEDLEKTEKLLKLKNIDLPDISRARNVEEILEDFNHLIGIADVKYTVQELLKYLDYSNKIDIEGFSNLNMVFKGNSGTGKTTVARLLTELLFKLGFIKNNKIIEVTSRDLVGEYIGQTPTKTQKVIDRALDGVLFIDNANTIMNAKGSSSDYAGECILVLIRAMEVYKDRLVIIFSGWTAEMNMFLNKNQGLTSRIGYEIEFPDFTSEELWQIFKTEAEGNGFTLEDNIEPRIRVIIKKNKVGRNFGNARFVINLFNNLVLAHASCYTDESKLKVIGMSDIEKYEETKKNETRNIDEILKELNSLIGLKNVKEVINGFVALIEFNKKLERTEDLTMHMIFKGNAGTGKTTVARLLAEIYYNLGYIRKNKLIEVQAKDLIAEYIGQTGPKTQAVIESALDGVLFVDEAYSIMQHTGSSSSFTDECIATFLKAMEDYQGRLIIIFAGYTEEMKEFRDQNPGLKSRIGFELEFKDYEIEELMDIFNKKLAERKLTIDEEALDKVKKILEKAKQVENFGNGRFVDTMLQKIIIEHAIRTRNIDDMEVLTKIVVEDVKDINAEESRKRIGF